MTVGRLAMAMGLLLLACGAAPVASKGAHDEFAAFTKAQQAQYQEQHLNPIIEAVRKQHGIDPSIPPPPPPYPPPYVSPPKALPTKQTVNPVMAVLKAFGAHGLLLSPPPPPTPPTPPPKMPPGMVSLPQVLTLPEADPEKVAAARKRAAAQKVAAVSAEAAEGAAAEASVAGPAEAPEEVEEKVEEAEEELEKSVRGGSSFAKSMWIGAFAVIVLVVTVGAGMAVYTGYLNVSVSQIQGGHLALVEKVRKKSRSMKLKYDPESGKIANPH